MNEDTIETILEKIWNLAIELYDVNELYQRDACEIQRIVSIISNKPERSNRLKRPNLFDPTSLNLPDLFVTAWRPQQNPPAQQFPDKCPT